jgi:EAL domain-containing protein (putative c-di-GMP-specific phosphodiesterase class I)
VRWRRNGVLTPPDRFIPIAEETGQIVPMTWWILEASCLALADWRRRGLGDDLWVHVNFSGRQLSEGNAVAGILAVVDRCGLPPGAVHIELTETSVLKQGDTVDATLAALRAAGLQLHLDDFGTGYSSISYLHRWRFDGIKIDRSFVSSIAEQPQRNIVAAIIQLARGLNMHVIAEGVETEEQAQILRDLGCPYAQGYLFAAALPADRARALLQASLPEPRIKLS